MNVETIKELLSLLPVSNKVGNWGCGNGSYLSVASELWNSECKGFDIDQKNINQYIGPDHSYHIIDFNKEIPIWNCDLAICVSTIHYLKDDIGKLLIKGLCESSPMVLFSSAIPNIDNNFENAQWQSYWQNEFSKYGFHAYEIKDMFTHNQKIPLEFHQSLVLYSNQDLGKKVRYINLNLENTLQNPGITQLEHYIDNTHSDINNFWLGYDYENNKQPAAAYSFYLRAAERTTNKNLAYECLIRMSFCLRTVENRNESRYEKLLQAISTIPDRPEAYYFLCCFFEQGQKWIDIEKNSNIGLHFLRNRQRTLTDLDYKIYGLRFQKGLAYYWAGCIDQSDKIMKELNEIENLDESLKTPVQNNIQFIKDLPRVREFWQWRHTPKVSF